jgi:hypothetical protein
VRTAAGDTYGSMFGVTRNPSLMRAASDEIGHKLLKRLFHAAWQSVYFLRTAARTCRRPGLSTVPVSSA